jgi:hypothetical protein
MHTEFYCGNLLGNDHFEIDKVWEDYIEMNLSKMVCKETENSPFVSKRSRFLMTWYVLS